MSEKICHDCEVKKGEFHKHGCDMEECPFCHRQLISCSCCYEKLYINPLEEPTYSKGLNKQQEEKWFEICQIKGLIKYGDETRFNNNKKSLLNEVDEDIKKMLLIISTFTEPNTEGEELLTEWQEKYL